MGAFILVAMVTSRVKGSVETHCSLCLIYTSTLLPFVLFSRHVDVYDIKKRNVSLDGSKATGMKAPIVYTAGCIQRTAKLCKNRCLLQDKMTVSYNVL